MILYETPPAIVQVVRGNEVRRLERELSVAQEAALSAGEVLLTYWKMDVSVQLKEGVRGDISPVTAADYASNELLCRMLVENFPDFGLLTEEEIADPQILEAISRWREAEYTWFIDPLDGTKSFVNGSDQFGIHIGLTRDGIPVLGVNYFPALKVMYWAVEGCGAYKAGEDGAAQQIFADGSEVIRPIRSSSEALFADQVYRELTGSADHPRAGSAGLRFSLIAEGAANFYVSQGDRGSLWDLCSGHIVLKEAGGILTDRYGNEIDYRSSVVEAIHGCIASGGEAAHKRALELLKSFP